MNEDYEDLIEEITYKLFNVFCGRKFYTDIVDKDGYTVIIPAYIRVNKHMMKLLALNCQSYQMAECEDKELLKEILKPFQKRISSFSENNLTKEIKNKLTIDSKHQELKDRMDRAKIEYEDWVKKLEEAKTEVAGWKEEYEDAKNALVEFEENF